MEMHLPLSLRQRAFRRGDGIAPITAEDVERSVKGMKDGALGPDGRNLKDMRAIPFDQLEAHFNLWLLSGYLPRTLRGGETLLLPKM